MSDGKLPPVLHHCRCVHRCGRQKAATGGKLPATKGVILRQVRCRFLSLFAAPVLPRFFHNDFVRRWCLSANRVSTAFASSPFVARPERMQLPGVDGSRSWSWPWTVRSRVGKTVSTVVSTSFATWFATGLALAVNKVRNIGSNTVVTIRGNIRSTTVGNAVSNRVPTDGWHQTKHFAQHRG